MKKSWRKDRENADRILIGFLAREIKETDVPPDELDRILERGIAAPGRPELQVKYWNPRPAPLPLRYAATAVFLAGSIYLSFFSYFGPEFEDLDKLYGVLKENASEFAWTAARSLGEDLNTFGF